MERHLNGNGIVNKNDYLLHYIEIVQNFSNDRLINIMLPNTGQPWRTCAYL